MNIYILMELSKREMDSNLLLSVLAANKGHHVLISNMDNFEYLQKKKIIYEGVFHTKSLVHDHRKSELHRGFNESNFLITSIDEENGLVKKNLKSFADRRFSNYELDKVKNIFCWGKDDYSYLKKKFKNYKKKFLLTGSARTDLWTKKFKNYWITNNFQPKKKILISTNFGLYNGFIPYKKIIKKQKLAGYFDRSKESEAEFKKIYRQNRISFKSFVELAFYLSEKFKNLEILLRPHPRENINTWKKIFALRKNVIVCNKGNFNSHLVNSLVLIQNGCTTAFQASLYDIPVISYVKGNIRLNHGSAANDLGIKCANKILVKKIIEKILKKKNINFNLKKKKIYNKLYIPPKKKLCSNKIIQTWEKISKNKDFNKRNSYFKISIVLKVFEFFKNFKKKISFFYKKNISDDIKFEKINANEVKYKIENIKKILKINTNILVKKLSNFSIIIYAAKNEK